MTRNGASEHDYGKLVLELVEIILVNLEENQSSTAFILSIPSIEARTGSGDDSGSCSLERCECKHSSQHSRNKNRGKQRLDRDPFTLWRSREIRDKRPKNSSQGRGSLSIFDSSSSSAFRDTSTSGEE